MFDTSDDFICRETMAGIRSMLELRLRLYYQVLPPDSRFALEVFGERDRENGQSLSSDGLASAVSRFLRVRPTPELLRDTQILSLFLEKPNPAPCLEPKSPDLLPDLRDFPTQ